MTEVLRTGLLSAQIREIVERELMKGGTGEKRGRREGNYWRGLICSFKEDLDVCDLGDPNDNTYTGSSMRCLRYYEVIGQLM